MPKVSLVAAAATIALAVTVAACGDGNGGTAEPTFQPTAVATSAPTTAATPTVQSQGAVNFGDFAEEVQSGLEDEGLSFITSRVKTEPVVCEADDVGAGPGAPICEFEGQTYDGFEVGFWQSEGAILPVEDAVAGLEDFVANILPDEQDNFGDGALRVYALNIQDDPGGDPAFDIIITAIVEAPETAADDSPLRVVIAAYWELIDGDWLMFKTLQAAVSSEDFLLPSTDVAALIFPNWERYER